MGIGGMGITEREEIEKGNNTTGGMIMEGVTELREMGEDKEGVRGKEGEGGGSKKREIEMGNNTTGGMKMEVVTDERKDGRRRGGGER